jgi:hypothetical protein
MSSVPTKPTNGATKASERLTSDYVTALAPIVLGMANHQRVLQYVFNVLMYNDILKWDLNAGAYFADGIDPFQITDDYWLQLCDNFDSDSLGKHKNKY